MSKKTKIIKSLCLIVGYLYILCSNIEMYGQKTSPINPIQTNNLPNVGWRDIKDDKEQPFDVNNPKHPTLSSNLKEKDLISVQPSSYCAISKFKKYSQKNLMTFQIEIKLQKGEQIEFDASKNIKMIIKDKEFNAYTSGTKHLSKGKILKGEINIPYKGNLSKEGSIATLIITVGSDTHRFDLSGQKSSTIQQLALIPYNPIWNETLPKEEPKKEQKESEQEKIVQIAVKKAEDITSEIKDQLIRQLKMTIAELKAKQQLTENTKVDVNAEVMPEVKTDGSVEYNMKVRYDVQVVSDYVKKT